MTAPYALVGRTLTPDAVGLAALVIQGGKIIDLVRSPRLKDLPPEQRMVSGTICPGGRSSRLRARGRTSRIISGR